MLPVKRIMLCDLRSTVNLRKINCLEIENLMTLTVLTIKFLIKFLINGQIVNYSQAYDRVLILSQF